MRWLDRITNSMNMILSKHQDLMKNREAWSAAVHGITESDIAPEQQKTTLLNKSRIHIFSKLAWNT